MMKILIFSDSHRRTSPMLDFIRKCRGDCDMAVHLGDVTDDAAAIRDLFPTLPLISIPGNCDYELSRQPQELFTTIEEVPTLMLHGHTRAVKSGLATLEGAAFHRGARLVLFGHTHEAYSAYRDGIYYLNPGSCSGWSRTAAVAELRAGQVLTNIVEL